MHGGPRPAGAPMAMGAVQPEVTQIICPPNATPGTSLQIVANGQQVTVQVPAGAVPNQPFAVQLPAPGPAGRRSRGGGRGADGRPKKKKKPAAEEERVVVIDPVTGKKKVKRRVKRDGESSGGGGGGKSGGGRTSKRSGVSRASLE